MVTEPVSHFPNACDGSLTTPPVREAVEGWVLVGAAPFLPHRPS